jgi:hypothetical protein
MGTESNRPDADASSGTSHIEDIKAEADPGAEDAAGDTWDETHEVALTDKDPSRTLKETPPT